MGPEVNQEVVCFDLFADYAQFKTYYTTMSPLSFAVPPGTALRGMLGALTGIEKEKAPEFFHDLLLSIQLINPLKKVNIPENLLKTTSKTHFSRFKNRKPTNIEFAKDVRYRVFITSGRQELVDLIKQHLFSHTSVYTLSLGISEALANYDNVEATSIKSMVSKKVAIESMIPTDAIRDIDFSDREVFTVNLPMKMKNDREVIEYREFAFERNGKSLMADVSGTVELANGKHVVFF